MAVPYGRKSRTKSRMQRAANMQYSPIGHVTCSNCDEPKLPHYVCRRCGQYDGRQVVKVVDAA